MNKTTEITGPVTVELHISSSTADADLFLVLPVFTPDMKEIRVSWVRSIRTRRSAQACWSCGLLARGVWRGSTDVRSDDSPTFWKPCPGL